MAVSTLGKRGGDFVVHVESPQKCFNTATLTLDTGGADGGGMASQIAGVPGVLSAGIFTPVLPAGQANTNAFLVHGPFVEDGTAAGAGINDSYKYTIIDNFDGAVLNEDMVATTDPVGAALTLATIKGASALANVKWVSEPTKKSTQTT